MCVLPVLKRVPCGWIAKHSPLANSIFLKDDFAFNFSRQTIIHEFQLGYQHALCPVQVGLKAQNVNLLTLNDRKEVTLFDFIKHNRMLVINFGSCT